MMLAVAVIRFSKTSHEPDTNELTGTDLRSAASDKVRYETISRPT